MLCKRQRCNRIAVAKGYCKSHHSTYLKSGEKDFYRTDLNQFIIINNTVQIILRDTHGNQIGEAIIDKADLEIVSKHKWYLTAKGYVMTRIDRKKQLFIHRLLLNPAPDKVIDHIDRDPLNNRRSNLRECTAGENLLNSKVRKDNITGQTGIVFRKSRNAYVARINRNGKEYYLGQFKNINDAVEVRKKAEKQLFKEFTPIIK